MSEPIVKPTTQELQLQINVEREFFETRCPIVHLIKRTRITHENLGVDVDDVLDETNPIELNANWDNNQRLREFRDGFYIDTKKLEVSFINSQLEEKEAVVKRGDVIDLDPVNKERFEVQQVRTRGRIRMSSTRLYTVATIDLEHRWTS